MKNEMLKEKLQGLLLEDTDYLMEIVEELNNWNGSLEDLKVYENDEEFFEMYFQGNPIEVARAIYYGDYKYMDEYVRFNGYGNLESLSDYQYVRELKDNVNEIIDNLMENYYNIYLPREIEEIFNNFEEEEEE